MNTTVFTIVFKERAHQLHHQLLRPMPRKSPHCWNEREHHLKPNPRVLTGALELTWSPRTTRWHFTSNTATTCAALKVAMHLFLFRTATGSFNSELPNNTEKASITCKVLSLIGLFVLGHRVSSKQNVKASPHLWAKSGGDLLEPVKCTPTALFKKYP